MTNYTKKTLKDTALVTYNECGGDDEPDPLERLRFFCSIAMSGQDWLDSEQFFDGITEAKASSSAIPKGYCLLPIEPTKEMKRAAIRADYGGFCNVGAYTNLIVYKAMLNAVVKPKS